MSALRAVNSPDDTTNAPTEAADIEAYDMRIDPEARLLCALMWTDNATGHIAQVIEFLTEADFGHYAHARLFGLIKTQHTAGEPMDATIVANKAAAAGAAGSEGWPGGKTPQMHILEVASLEARTEQASYLAELVVGRSYRRQFQTMTAYLSQMAEEAHEDELFDIMAEQGRRQRIAKNRLDRFRREVLGRSTDTTTKEN
ncbi:MAG: DnaB-like helicase N-terminal domain-containing protein [Micrococcaceae bacterium]